jgi:hypothetical protein
MRYPEHGVGRFQARGALTTSESRVPDRGSRPLSP